MHFSYRTFVMINIIIMSVKVYAAIPVPVEKPPITTRGEEFLMMVQEQREQLEQEAAERRRRREQYRRRHGRPQAQHSSADIG